MLAHETTSRNYVRKRFVSCLSHLAIGKLLKITPFHTQRPRNYKICLSGQKILSYHICYENLAKYLRVKRENDRQRQKYWGYFQQELNNILVKKKVLNDLMKKVHSLKAPGIEIRFKEQYIKI